MNPPVTVDASVFVSAFTPTELAHLLSQSFMRRIREQSTPIIVPILVLPEISAALSRGQGKAELGLGFVREIRKLPNTHFIDIDDTIATLAVEIAANHRLRGSDAVYAAVALRFGCELVTLDKEQLERLPGIVAVRSPAT